MLGEGGGGGWEKRGRAMYCYTLFVWSVGGEWSGVDWSGWGYIYIYLYVYI